MFFEEHAPVFCVNDNFQGTFADFCWKISTQERISIYVDPCP